MLNIVISKHIENITLNSKEFLLDSENGNIRKFKSKREAVDFLLGIGYKLDDIGYSVFVGTKENPDQVTIPDLKELV